MRGDRDGGAPLPDAMYRAIGESLDRAERRYPLRRDGPMRRTFPAPRAAARFPAPACGASGLSYHKADGKPALRRCKGLFPYEERCPYCGSDLIRFFEVGAEYLEARIKEAFPAATVARVTGEADKPAGGRQRPGDAGIIVRDEHPIEALRARRGPAYPLRMGRPSEDRRVQGDGADVPGLSNLRDALRPARLLFHTRKTPSTLPFSRYATSSTKTSWRKGAPPSSRPSSAFSSKYPKRNREAGERVIQAIERLAQEAGLDHQMLGPIQVKGEYGWKVIFKGDGEAAFSAPFLPLPPPRRPHRSRPVVGIYGRDAATLTPQETLIDIRLHEG